MAVKWWLIFTLLTQAMAKKLVARSEQNNAAMVNPSNMHIRDMTLTPDGAFGAPVFPQEVGKTNGADRDTVVNADDAEQQLLQFTADGTFARFEAQSIPEPFTMPKTNKYFIERNDTACSAHSNIRCLPDSGCTPDILVCAMVCDNVPGCIGFDYAKDGSGCRGFKTTIGTCKPESKTNYTIYMKAEEEPVTMPEKSTTTTTTATRTLYPKPTNPSFTEYNFVQNNSVCSGPKAFTCSSKSNQCQPTMVACGLVCDTTPGCKGFDLNKDGLECRGFITSIETCNAKPDEKYIIYAKSNVTKDEPFKDMATPVTRDGADDMATPVTRDGTDASATIATPAAPKNSSKPSPESGPSEKDVENSPSGNEGDGASSTTPQPDAAAPCSAVSTALLLAACVALASAFW